MSFRMTFSDLKWLSEIFNDTKHRAVSLRQLSFLSTCPFVRPFVRQLSFLLIGRKSRFFIPVHSTTPPLGKGPRRNAITFGTAKTKVVWKKFDMLSRFDRIPACDRQTDGQTDGQTSCHGIVRAMHTRRAVKTRMIGLQCSQETMTIC